MFCIFIPFAITPLIIVLFYAENKARKLGLVQQVIRRADPAYVEPENLTIFQRIWKFIENIDLFGLVLLGVSVAMILLPLTLAETASKGWKNREYRSNVFR